MLHLLGEFIKQSPSPFQRSEVGLVLGLQLWPVIVRCELHFNAALLL